MNLALIGSGGREHALCKNLKDSINVKKIYCIPGNAGTLKYAENLNCNLDKFKSLLKVLKLKKIDYVIIGPEEPLVKGLVDFLTKNKIKVFGPNKYAAKLEGSKSFMKMICKKNKIPTASFRVCNNILQVKNFLKFNKLPLVVKADGIAAGKGVTICKSSKKVIQVCSEIFSGKFKSSKKLILEEFLKGQEMSYFLVVDKNNFSFIGSAQDHKKVGEKETGPNTGGMGAFSPSPLMNKKLEKKIIKSIVQPTLNFLKKKNQNYTGFLYVGLMIKDNNPYLIEYNVRMGDPECQVIIPRLKTNLFTIIKFALNNKLNKLNIRWKNEKCMTIVVCAKGYPNNYKKYIDIDKIRKIKVDTKTYIFHAGTKVSNNKYISNGGRIINVTSSGTNFLKIRKKIMNIIKKLNLRYTFYRKDIGWRVIKN